ncbi:MAG: hypothetical protein ACOH14_12185 [Rhodoglobus sp.]
MTEGVHSLRKTPAGTVKPAYAALMLGVVAAALFQWPPLATALGFAGLVTALYARQTLRAAVSNAGTVPSLVGAVLSVIGIASCLPWVFSVVFVALAG